MQLPIDWHLTPQIESSPNQEALVSHEVAKKRKNSGAFSIHIPFRLGPLTNDKWPKFPYFLASLRNAT